jgi:hypothetical protein
MEIRRHIFHAGDVGSRQTAKQNGISASFYPGKSA